MSQQTLDQQANDVCELVRAVRTLLSGKDPTTVGTALADLTAIWIASHTAATQEETDRWRDELLTTHIEAIETLIPANAREEEPR